MKDFLESVLGSYFFEVFHFLYQIQIFLNLHVVEFFGCWKKSHCVFVFKTHCEYIFLWFVISPHQPIKFLSQLSPEVHIFNYNQKQCLKYTININGKVYYVIAKKIIMIQYSKAKRPFTGWRSLKVSEIISPFIIATMRKEVWPKDLNWYEKSNSIIPKKVNPIIRGRITIRALIRGMKVWCIVLGIVAYF